MENKDLLTERQFWADYWNTKRDQLIVEVSENGFHARELDAVLSGKKIRTSIELGGFPGTFSVYVKRKYGVDATLLDYYIDESITSDLLLANGLQKGDIQLIEDDLTLDHEVQKKYDLVFSIGLIEHFNNVKQIVARHLDFMEPDGELLIILPNFRGVNGWIQRKFNRPNYDVHNLASMDLRFLKSIAEELGLQNISVYHTGKFSIWLDNWKTQPFYVKFFFKCVFFAGKALTKLIPFESRLLSPLIVLKGNLSGSN